MPVHDRLAVGGQVMLSAAFHRGLDLLARPVSVSDVKVRADETAVPVVVLHRLRTEQRAWMTTLRAQDGSPHVTPVWFVYQPSCWWVSAQARSVKVHNLERDSRVALALEDGVNPVVAEGRARIHHDKFPTAIVQCFATKYADWDIRTDDQAQVHRVLIEITQTRWLLLGSAP